MTSNLTQTPRKAPDHTQKTLIPCNQEQDTRLPKHSPPQTPKKIYGIHTYGDNSHKKNEITSNGEQTLTSNPQRA